MVWLKPDAASIAEQLKREFGSMVELTVGFKRFPEVPPFVPVPQALEAGDSLPMIRVTCEVDATHLHGGDAIAGRVVMRNTGDSDVEATGSAGTGCLCRPGTLEAVGGYSGLIADVGHVLHLRPGASQTLPFIVGTASSEPGAGYVVPAGRYEVVVPVGLEVEGRGAVRILARHCFIEVA